MINHSSLITNPESLILEFANPRILESILESSNLESLNPS